MTPARRRLVALAAALVPARAAALLGRLGDADAAEAGALAAALAQAPRRARLSALVAALPPLPARRAGHPLLARLRLEREAGGEVRPADPGGPCRGRPGGPRDRLLP